MILVTAFEPFAGLTANPSEDVARTLEERDVDCCVLPVSYRSVEETLLPVLERPWDAVLMLGLAHDREGLSLERVARNQTDGSRRDNEGKRTLRRKVVRGGPAAYFSSLPLDRMQNELVRANIPSHVSSDAGLFLCNHVFYLARHTLGNKGVPCGFIHLPPTPNIVDGDGPSMTLTEQIRATRVLLDVLRDE